MAGDPEEWRLNAIALKAVGVDAVICTSPTDVLPLTGYHQGMLARIADLPAAPAGMARHLPRLEFADSLILSCFPVEHAFRLKSSREFAPWAAAAEQLNTRLAAIDLTRRSVHPRQRTVLDCDWLLSHSLTCGDGYWADKTGTTVADVPTEF